MTKKTSTPTSSQPWKSTSKTKVKETALFPNKTNPYTECVTCIPDFDPDFIRSKSGAAAGLCSWVINVCKFYEVFCEVEPKRRALNDANQMLQDAQTRPPVRG